MEENKAKTKPKTNSEITPDPVLKTKKPKSGRNIEEFLRQRRSYIMGIFVGVVLIIINFYVGLYMMDLLLTEKDIPVIPGISLPAIRVADYEKVRDTYLSRQQKELPPPPPVDPYRTSL